jgi:hypothetical protein
MMSGPRWILLAGLTVFVVTSAYLVLQVISARHSADLAAHRGRPGRAVLYSLTGAMFPWKKETARLHLPVYILGIAYHLGVLVSLLWLAASFARADLSAMVISGSVILLGVTASCGLALLVRRITNSKLRHFSSPDDYFSNVLVTGFQALTAVALLDRSLMPGLFVYGAVLLVYIPQGKLRHAIYYILARVYLGIFYGRRGTWSADGSEQWQVRRT